MIERAFIHVTGPRGTGKTTLIAHLLRKTDRTVAAVRCIRDDGIRDPQETAPKGHAELNAYRAAGADPVALYRFPQSHADWDAFYATSLMEDYFEAVLLEGDRLVPWVDLTVYVALPVPEGESLLLQGRTDPARERAAEIEGLEEALSNRERMGARLTALSGLPIALLLGNSPDGLDELEGIVNARLGELRKAPFPAPRAYWALADGYDGIQDAQLVVVNVRDGRHAEAETMLSDLRRLRADKAVFDDIFDWKGKRTPITAVAANLADPRDPGLCKAVARIKRALQQYT
jgi:hypothetical protein